MFNKSLLLRPSRIKNRIKGPKHAPILLKKLRMENVFPVPSNEVVYDISVFREGCQKALPILSQIIRQLATIHPFSEVSANAGIKTKQNKYPTITIVQ